jgi:hypothetical protein
MLPLLDCPPKASLIPRVQTQTLVLSSLFAIIFRAAIKALTDDYLHPACPHVKGGSMETFVQSIRSYRGLPR